MQFDTELSSQLILPNLSIYSLGMLMHNIVILFLWCLETSYLEILDQEGAKPKNSTKFVAPKVVHILTNTKQKTRAIVFAASKKWHDNKAFWSKFSQGKI